MTFFTDGPLLEPEQQGIHELPLSTAAYAGESFMHGLEEGPVAQGFRALGNIAAGGIGGHVVESDPMGNPTISPQRVPDFVPNEDAKKQIAAAGLDKDIDLGSSDTGQGALDLMMQHARERRHRQAQLARGPSGVLPGVAATGAEFFSGALDPINLAAFSIPVAGEARIARLMAGAGESLIARAAMRGGIGAAQGAVGGAALIPYDAWAWSEDGRDYGMADALRSIIGGAAMGGGFHAIGGGVADIYRGFRGRPLYPFGPGEPFARAPAAAGEPAGPSPGMPPEAPAPRGTPPLPPGYPHVEALLDHPAVRGETPNPRLGFTLDDVLRTPSVANAIEHPAIDREHDVPYGAAAGDAGTHLDRNIPTSATVDGVTFDPAIPANIARQVEREAMERMFERFRAEMGQEPHDRQIEKIMNLARQRFAEPAERAWVEGQGIDWENYRKAWKGWTGKIDHENPENPPAGMYLAPFPPRLREKLRGGEAAAHEAVVPPPDFAKEIAALPPRGRKWIDVPEGKIYLRRVERPNIGQTIDIPSIDFEVKGTGAFTRYLDEIEQAAQAQGIDAVYVENILNDRLVNFLGRRGYVRDGSTTPPSLYKRFMAGAAPGAAEPAPTAEPPAPARTITPAHNDLIDRVAEQLTPEEIAAIDRLTGAPTELAQIAAFHGSPHYFERFDASKIGTGEGAAAFGHGLYFAEHEGVAESYKGAGTSHTAAGTAARALRYFPTREDAIKSLENKLGPFEPKYYQEAIDFLRDPNWKPQEPSLYKVSLKPDKEDLLDWDKPLSEQSPKVQQALRPLINKFEPGAGEGRLPKSLSGEQLYYAYSRELYKEQEQKAPGTARDTHAAMSEALRAAGIPGIKYLDQGSRVSPAQLETMRSNLETMRRSAETATGDMKAWWEKELPKAEQEYESARNPTHNFVIFDDKDVEITHRNGEPVTKQERAAAVKELYQRGEGGMPGAESPKGWDFVEPMPLWKADGLQRLPRPGETPYQIGPNTRVIYTPREAYTEKETEFATAIDAVMRKMFPDAEYSGFRHIEIRRQGVTGVFVSTHDPQFPSFIGWALHSPDPVGTMRHEGLHFLKNMGYLNPSEWGVLEKAADDGGWIGKHNIDTRYHDVPRWLQLEEAIAEEFRLYQRGETKDIAPPVRTIFDRIVAALKAVAEVFRRTFGKDTFEDVFNRIERGEVGHRFPEQDPAGTEAAQRPEEGRQRASDSIRRLVEREPRLFDVLDAAVKRAAAEGDHAGAVGDVVSALRQHIASQAPARPEEAPAARQATRLRPKRGPAAKDEGDYSLLEFIASRGGLKETADLRSILDRNPLIPGFGRLLRKDGMSVDDARGAAAAAGYFAEDPNRAGGDATTINQLYDAIRDEARGRKHYRLGKEREEAADPDAVRAAHERHVGNMLEEAGVDPQELGGERLARIVEIMAREHVRDPEVAFERAVMEEASRAADDGTAPQPQNFVPGWDVDESGAAPAESGVLPQQQSAEGEGIIPPPRDGGEGIGAEAQPLAAAIEAPAAEPPGPGAVNPATGTDETLSIPDATQVLKGAVASLIEGKPVKAADVIDAVKADEKAATDRDSFIEAMRNGQRITRNGTEYWIEQKETRTKGGSTFLGTWVVRSKYEGIAVSFTNGPVGAELMRGGWSREYAARKASEEAGFPTTRDFLAEEQPPISPPEAPAAEPVPTEAATPAAAPEPTTPETPAATPASLSDHFRDYFLGADKFDTIVQARKFAADKGFDLDNKQIEEAIEFGAVKAAKQIATGLGSDTDKLDRLIALYGRQPRLSTRTSTSMREQAFSTPVPLAYLASRIAGVADRVTVYEPSAGNGALLMEARPPNYVHANEINPARAANLREQGFRVTEKDASSPVQGKDIRQTGGVDVVLANPPFGAVKSFEKPSGGKESKVFDLSDIQPGYSTHEIDHAIALRALEAMKDDGRAVLLIGGLNKLAKSDEARSDGYNAKAKREFFKVLFDRYNVTDHFTVAGELYERQGAGWPIDVLSIEGRGASVRRLPSVNLPRVYDSWDELKGVLDGLRERPSKAGGPPGGIAEPVAPRGAAGADEGVPAPPAGGGIPGGVAGGEPEAVRPGPVPVEPGGTDAGAGGGAPGQELAVEGQPQPGGPGGGPAAERPAPGVGRKLYIGSFRNNHTVFEQVRGGSRAVSKTFSTKEEAEDALRKLRETDIASPTATAGVEPGAPTETSSTKYVLPSFVTAQYRQPEGEAPAAEQAAEATREALDPSTSAQEPPTERKAAKKQETETASQVAYVPQSARGQPLGTLVPVNMKKSTADSLAAVARRNAGDLDRFVASELGYDLTKNDWYETMTGHYAAEQIDALALALDNIKAGKGFIIGDQTGIGKGRVNAGIIRWARLNGRIPVFVTEKPNLFGDIYRDLTATGFRDVLDHEPRFVMTNADEKINLTSDGKVTLESAPGESHNQLLQMLPARDPEAFLKQYDAVFTTYNQMQTVSGGDTVRRDFLRAIAPNSVVLFDESHNAGGQKQGFVVKGKPENRADFARNLVQQATGVFYSSATYAKRPDVMDLYSKTDMGLAVADPRELGETIARGGVPMQQAVASMLARAGQYLRRERSFHGVEYNTPVVPVDRGTYDGMSRSLKSVNDFSKIVADVADKLDESIKGDAASVSHDGSTGGAGASSTNFTAVMHNVINQFLLATKAQSAAKLAIEALERGEKPVITVSGTMESFLNNFADDMGLKKGDAVSANFVDVLLRYLERTRTLIIKKPFAKKGESERHYLTDVELGPVGMAAYNSAKKAIKAVDFAGMPISPIDSIKADLAKAGYRVGEITGRGNIIDYSGKQPVLKARPTTETSIMGRARTIDRFNGGSADNPLPAEDHYDALVLNQAGATGLSLHASETFGDRRQRHMFVAQPEANIDTHMQLLGRIHRTGQVVLPKYSQLIADIPAEKRPAAVLAKKMASLNANTTAARGGALAAKDVPDFMNEYGDLVAMATVNEDPELSRRLDLPASIEDGPMRILTGRIPLLPLKEQEALYGRLEEDYKSLLDQMKAAGENALEAQTLDMRTKTLETREVVAGKGGDSPFAAPVNIEKVSAKRLGKPYRSDEVATRILEGNGEGESAKGVTADNAVKLVENASDPSKPLGKRIAERHDAQAADAAGRFANYQRQVLDEFESPERREAEKVKMDAVKDRWEALHGMTRPGERVVLKTSNGNLNGIVLKVDQKGEPRNPLALSTWRAKIAIADATREITLHFSRLFEEGKSDPEDALAIEIGPISDWLESKAQTLDRFDKQQSDTREERYVATGNLLAGYDWLRRKGRIVNYTDDAGHVRQGILTPKDFNLEEFAQTNRTAIGDETAVMKWLDDNPGETVSTKDNLVNVRVSGRNAEITAAGAKRLGGVYYLDKPLTDITGDFQKRGGVMAAQMPKMELEHAIKRIQELGGQFVAIKDLPPGKAAPAAAARPQRSRQEEWQALAATPRPHEDPEFIARSQEAASRADPDSALGAPAPVAAAKAAQSAEEQFRQAAEMGYMSEAERAQVEKVLQEVDQAATSRAATIREGVACLTLGGFAAKEP